MKSFHQAIPMKNIAISLIFLSLTWISSGQSPARLIVRADDIGSSQAANQAIIKTCTEGIATSAEVMVTAPWFPEAVKLLNQHPGIDVGVHLTITSEWDNMKWRPLTDCPGLVDESGYFYPMMWPNANYPGLSVMEKNPPIAEVEKEFRAQIELAMKLIPSVSHISGHMGSTFYSEEVRALSDRLAKEYKLGNDTAGRNVKGVRFDGPSRTFAEKEASFINMLEKLEAGQTYLFVEHPGLDTPEMRGIHHVGYEHVAEDRQGVTDLFLSDKVKAKIKEKGIVLISYSELYQSEK